MSNGPCRASSTLCRAVPQIAGPLRAIVPSGPCLYGLRVQSSAQGTTREPVPVKHVVSCQPTVHQTDNSSCLSIFSPNAKIFHYFYQLFIIFTNITINSIYIQVITTPTVHVHRAAIGPTAGTGHAACLDGGPGMAQSLRPGRARPGGHRAMPCSGRTKSPGHGPHGHVW